MKNAKFKTKNGSLINRTAWSRFAHDTSGNFASLFALASVPLLGFSGLAVEYTRFSMINERVGNALDASGLAISQRATALGYDSKKLTPPQQEDLRQYGINFFHANFKSNPSVKDFSVDFIFSETTLTPKVTGTMDTSLLKLIGIDELNLSRDTEITLFGAGRLELALVLDVTGSMGFSAGNGQTRMEVLKDAVTDMMDSLYGEEPGASNDNLRVSIVPFNSVVNIGSHASQSSWMDEDAESMFHGNAFFHVEDHFDIDANQKVNLFELFDSIGHESEWKGCVESRPYPLDELDTVPGSSVSSAVINAWDNVPSEIDPSVTTYVRDAFNDAPSLPYSASTVGDADNSRFVPYFYPDEPDCYYSCGFYVYHSSYPHVSDTAWPGYMMNYIDEDGDQYYGYLNRNFIQDRYYTNTVYGSDDAVEDYVKVVCQYKFNRFGATSGGCGDYPLAVDQDWIEISNKTTATYGQQDEYRIRQAYPGIYNPSTNRYEGKYDQTVSVSEGGESAGQGPNRYCSTEVLPLTTQKSEVMSTLNSLTPGGATNTAVGAIWGWRALSPEAPFSEGSDPTIETDWRKAVVLMTDGQNSITDIYYSHNKSIFGAYGYPSEDRMGIDGGGTMDPGDWNEALDDKTIRICHNMQQDNIKVYTVGFSIAEGSNADLMLRACASKPTGENKTYFLAENSHELKEVFREITEDLVNLHVSR